MPLYNVNLNYCNLNKYLNRRKERYRRIWVKHCSHPTSMEPRVQINFGSQQVVMHLFHPRVGRPFTIKGWECTLDYPRWEHLWPSKDCHRSLNHQIWKSTFGHLKVEIHLWPSKGVPLCTKIVRTFELKRNHRYLRKEIFFKNGTWDINISWRQKPKFFNYEKIVSIHFHFFYLAKCLLCIMDGVSRIHRDF